MAIAFFVHGLRLRKVVCSPGQALSDLLFNKGVSTGIATPLVVKPVETIYIF